jgi:septal ring factor EnvC (AmiA/AmiB activator)
MTRLRTAAFVDALKQMQSDLAALKEGQRETNSALNAIRIHMVAMAQDIQNLYVVLTRHETRLDRIERRLEIADAPV